MRRAFLVILGLAGCAAQRGVIWGEVKTPIGPIPNAPILVSRNGEAVRRGAADQQGHFEIRGLGPGEHRVEALVDAGVLAPGTWNGVAVDLPRDGIRNAEIQIIPASLGAPLSGVLIDQFNRPVPNEEVCASDRGGLSAIERCASTGIAGRFSIPWLPNGPNSVTLRTNWADRSTTPRRASKRQRGAAT